MWWGGDSLHLPGCNIPLAFMEGLPSIPHGWSGRMSQTRIITRQRVVWKGRLASGVMARECISLGHQTGSLSATNWHVSSRPD
jgi:hypothetical protein